MLNQFQTPPGNPPSDEPPFGAANPPQSPFAEAGAGGPSNQLPIFGRGKSPFSLSPRILQRVGQLISQDEMFKDAGPQQISDRMRVVENVVKIIRENLQLQDTRSRKVFFTHVLTDSIPALTIDSPFVLTHIYRDDECYDTVDTTTNSYETQKIQIKVNGADLFSEKIPISLLPKTGQYAYKLATPYYLAQNTKLEIDGGTGLDDMKIYFYGYYQCFSVTVVPVPHVLVIESAMQATSPELNPVANIPSWMMFCHKWLHCAQLYLSAPNTYTYNNYGNAATNYLQGTVRFPYPHGNIVNLKTAQPARGFAGTREFRQEMPEEFLTPGVSVVWEKSTTTFGVNEWYDYMLIGGYHFAIL